MISPHRGYRSCVVCRKRDVKGSLCRVSLQITEEAGCIVVDFGCKVQSRGAYIHLSVECIRKFSSKTLSHNFRKQLKQLSRASGTVLDSERLEAVIAELLQLVSD